MANMIKVNTNVLGKDIQEMRTLANSVERDLNDIYALVSALDAMWDGPANDKFRREFSADKKVCANVVKEINRLINDTTSAKTKYESCERNVHSLVGSLRV